MTRPNDPPAKASSDEPTYVQVLGAYESRRMAADDLILRSMLQDSLRPLGPPKRPST